jgi:hypothetical protein
MDNKHDIEDINIDIDINIGIEKLKQKNKDISKVINRYMRIKRKRFFRKILYLGLRSN